MKTRKDYKGVFTCENFYTIIHGVGTINMRLSNPLVATEELAEKETSIMLYLNSTTDYDTPN